MTRRRLVIATALACVALGAAGYGCSDDEQEIPPPIVAEGGPPRDAATSDVAADTSSGGKTVAKADIRPTSDASVVTGSVTFTEENGEVTAVVDITSGFPPGGPGLRGIHIHTNPSCEANDSGPDGAIVPAGGAGSHWNPADASHGLPSGSPHHLGDMGNIDIGDAGTGRLVLVSKEWTVKPGTSSVVGHAVVVHAQQDDGVSQPVGDAGARPGCGVIVLQ